MNKRLTILLLALLGAVLFLAHTTHAEMKLNVTKIEMNGEVKLKWSKAAGANSATEYTVYRAVLQDSSFTSVVTTADTSYVDHVPPVMSPLPQVYVYKVVAKTGLNLETSNFAYASVPGFPVVGGFRLEGKVEHGKAKLGWQKPNIGGIIRYEVYRGKSGAGIETHVLIDTTSNLFSVTDVPVSGSGSGHTTYLYYVKAILTSGGPLVSTTVQLTIYPSSTRDEIKFISQPILYAQKDVQYQYTAKAVSTDPAAVIRYFAERTSNGGELAVSVDSVSGLLTWTPGAKGMYKIVLSARSSKGGSAKQEFTVTVSGGNGVMQGKISDKASVGIPNVIVELYKSENNSSLFYVYSAKTDANGNYRVNRIDPGNYKVRANSPSMKYQSAWYDTAREVSQAKIVNVPDSSMGVTQVSMKLRDGFPPVSFKTISGTVTDTAGFAIDDAETRVTFVRVEFALNIAGGAGGGLENFRKYFDVNRHGDYRMEGNSEFVFKAKVDSLGKYSVLLPPGGYIAFARANGYAAEYYNEQSSILSAQAIRVLADTTGINFTLSPLPPVALGAISGSVQDTLNDIPVASRVIAFRDGWRFNDLHKIGKVYVTDTDSLGAYTFQDVLPGNYVVMALPLGNYAPAFYADDSLSFRWKHATKIAVNGNTIDNINIYVRPLGTSASGYTSIVGSVSLSGGLTGGSLRAGAVVYAYRNNEIAGYSFTNAEGQYMISGLAPGQYSVFVDKAGYDESSVASVSASYDLLGNPQSGSANFTLNSVLGVNVVSTVVPELFTLEQNYPNPFNPSTTIRFALPAAAQTVLKVYNVVGQEVATLVNEYREAGTFEATFDASKLSSGIYFYALKAGDQTQARKMVLVK